MANNRNSGIWEWALVRFIIIGSLILFSAFLYYFGFTEDGVRMVIRWSARISVTCFCIAFAASYFHKWQRNSFSFWVNMNRKYWGISFAIIHLIHLAALIVLQQFFHPVFELAASVSLMAGGLAYLFIILMLLTSFESFSKYLSRQQWKLLHTVGGYWIWFIFFNSYRRGVMRGEWWDLPELVLLIGVLLLRLWKRG